jgi:hypothetical protein
VDFGRVLGVIAPFLDREGFRYAFAGALGLHAYGVTRSTEDMDFVTESRAREKVVAFLEGLGYETLHVSEGYSNHLHGEPALGRIDFVYVGGKTARLIFEGCAKTLILAGRAVPVPRAEHLAAMKVQAMKNDPKRAFQELADIQQLLQLPGVERAEIRGYFEKAGLLERYLELERLA